MLSEQKNKNHIIWFALITALCLLADSMLYVVLPIHYREAGLSSLWEVGLILAVNRIARIPLNPLVSRLYCRLNERAGIILAIILTILATAIYSFLPSFIFWIIARCLWGLAWTLLRIGSFFCIFKLSDRNNRGRYTGLFNGLFRLGSLTGMFLGGLLADYFGLQLTVIVFCILTSFSIIPALLFIPKTKYHEDEKQTKLSSLLPELKNMLFSQKTGFLILSGGIVALVIQGILAPTLSLLISDHSGGGIKLGELFFGAAALGGFFQALRWGWEPFLAPLTGKLSDFTFGRVKMLRLTFGAAAFFLIVLTFYLPLPLWFCILIIIQLTATALTTLADATLTEAASISGKQNLLVLYSLISDTGMAIGPLAAYGLNEFFGVNFVYIWASALCILAVFLLGRRVPR
jgi:MFS family permease